ADQRAGPAAARRAVLRRTGGPRAAADPGPAGRRRADLLPLPQVVPAVEAVGPGFLAAGRAAVARHLDQAGDGNAGDAGGTGRALRPGELFAAAVLSSFTVSLHYCNNLTGGRVRRGGWRETAGG